MLSLAEEFLLLSLDDEKGSFALWTDQGIAGAVLTELFLRHRIELADKVVRVTDASPTRDDVMDFVLDLIAEADKPKGVDKWLWAISRQREKVREAVIQRLVDEGILRRKEGRTLGLFGWVRYPQADGSTEESLVAELREVLLSRKTPDSRTGSLIALAKACGVMGSVLHKQEQKQAKARIEEVCSGQALPSEVHAAVHALQAALTTVIFIAST